MSGTFTFISWLRPGCMLTQTCPHTIVWLIYQLHCVTFLQYSWLSITPPFPNHIKLEQLESISRDALQCSQLASAIFGATILWLLWTWSICSCKNCAKINLPFQSLLELENQLAHDALNELIASNYCKYCLKVVFHLKLSFCRTKYTSMMSELVKQ